MRASASLFEPIRLSLGRHTVRCRRALAPLAALALVLLMAVPVAARPHWTEPRQILAMDGAPRAHATVVDADGDVHVAIERPDRPGIWYATDVGDGWQVRRVTRQRDVEPAIAVDGATVTIAFARLDDGGDSRGIFTATRRGSDWTVERVSDQAGRKPAMDAADGIVHVAFRSDDRLMYLRLGAGIREEHASSYCCGGAPSLQLDDRDRPVIAFSEASGLVIGRERAGDWDFELVDRGDTRHPTLVIDGGRPHVAYVRAGEGPVVRAFFPSQVNNISFWEIRPVAGGRRPLDLLFVAGSGSAYAVGVRDGERGRILRTEISNDTEATLVVPEERGVRSVEVERLPDAGVSRRPVLVFGRDDGLWTMRNVGRF
ncbi:MAG: hypothetical protein M3452_02400 [Chloroflexota bacterium]|nr:hypothetical protein [Chloroflexota bacterium]